MRADDIRPPELLSRFKRASEAAARAFLADSARLERVPCPACQESRAAPAFERTGFAYLECTRCRTLYVGIRPSADALVEHYRASEAAAIRIDYFVRDTASARFEHIVQSRIDWIGEHLDGLRGGGPVRIADIGTLYPGMLDELLSLDGVGAVSSLGTDPRIAERFRDEIQVEPSDEPFDLITAFEQLEHQASPIAMLQRLYTVLGPTGVLLMTTRSASGFDVLSLWEGASFLLIPEHLNLLSLDGIEILLARAGFEALELSTPGELDAANVRQELLSGDLMAAGRFARTLLLERGNAAIDDFQAFLQKHRLSSHVRVAARRLDGAPPPSKRIGA